MRYFSALNICAWPLWTTVRCRAQKKVGRRGKVFRGVGFCEFQNLCMALMVAVWAFRSFVYYGTCVSFCWRHAISTRCMNSICAGNSFNWRILYAYDTHRSITHTHTHAGDSPGCICELQSYGCQHTVTLNPTANFHHCRVGRVSAFISVSLHSHLAFVHMLQLDATS